jgi:hypothetical protein
VVVRLAITGIRRIKTVKEGIFGRKIGIVYLALKFCTCDRVDDDSTCGFPQYHIISKTLYVHQVHSHTLP